MATAGGEMSPEPRSRGAASGGRRLAFGFDVVRRVFNLHGSAVNNAAASVRADDVARDARDSAAEAVALATAPPGNEGDLSTTDPQRVPEF